VTVRHKRLALQVLDTIIKNPRVSNSELAEKYEVTQIYMRQITSLLVQVGLTNSPAPGVHEATELGSVTPDYVQKELPTELQLKRTKREKKQ
jgi:DNA-binding IscR family transcriptional regulator